MSNSFTAAPGELDYDDERESRGDVRPCKNCKTPVQVYRGDDIPGGMPICDACQETQRFERMVREVRRETVTK